jgi:ABC-type thiamine transport system substrate-binding protein
MAPIAFGVMNIYTMGDDNAAITAYLDFMLSPEVQQLAQHLSYIPISSMKLPAVGATTFNESEAISHERL